jgi:hypothetical protein
MFEDSRSLRHTTLGRTAVDGRSARLGDLYLTTHNNHNRQISMPPAGFEPTIPAREGPQTHSLDRATSGMAVSLLYITKNGNFNENSIVL